MHNLGDTMTEMPEILTMKVLQELCNTKTLIITFHCGRHLESHSIIFNLRQNPSSHFLA